MNSPKNARNPRLVVLGAGGFVGRRVVAALADIGWATPVAATHSTMAKFPAGVECIRVDVTVENELTRALDGAVGVVNCVTGSYDTIVNGARALFDVAGRMASPPRVVHMSTMSVYGSTTGDVDETAPLRGDLGSYSAGKVEAETLAAQCRTVILLRPGIVYGPGSTAWSDQIGRLLMARRLGDLGSAGDGICNLVHVNDVAQATLLALHLPNIEGQAFNLSLPEPPSWNEYFIRYARALGAVPVHRLSQRRLKLEKVVLAPPLKIAEIVAAKAGLRGLRLPPLIPPSQLRLYRHEIRLLVQKAEAVLGMKWTPLDQGLRETAAWFLARS